MSKHSTTPTNNEFDAKSFIEQHNYPSNTFENYPTHVKHKKPLKFILQDKPVEVFGGSCHHPTIDDADVYVSLDVAQPVYYWEQPWSEKENKQHVRFPIEDMFIPEDSHDFKSCITYLQSCLKQGKKMHVGCIGGHGRTGMVLSALVQASMADKLIDKKGNKMSAIDYVRDNYAREAVETVPQMLFLHYSCDIALPKNSGKEVQRFLNFFEKQVGISLKDIMQKGVQFDELFELIKEVDKVMFSQATIQRNPVGKTDFLTQQPNNNSTIKNKM